MIVAVSSRVVCFASYEDVTVMPMCWLGLLLVAATWRLRSA